MVMLTIDVKGLDKQAGLAIQFLGSKLNDGFKVKGGQLQLTSTKARAAKLLLHKFLRREGLRNYRVVVVHPGLVQVLKPEVKKKHTRQEKRNYGVPYTIPQYQVAAELGGQVPKPGERKWKP